jgi:hypothetical protein
MVSLWIQLVIAVGIFAAGAAGGIRWHIGVDAIAYKAAQAARESDAIQQRKFSDKAAGTHAAALATLNDKLGAARAQIASLSGRDCVGPRTIGVLNAIGSESVRTTPGEPQSPSAAASSGGGLRFSTDRDLAESIAICRARYAEVSGQLTQILDIEDRRNPP